VSGSGSVCPGCGAPASGNFCSACGHRLAAEGACGACGARLSPGAMYCADCGAQVAARQTKPASARLPWILSALALAAFSILIAVLVQRGSVARTGEMTLTGGLPAGEVPGGAPGGAPGASGGMPSVEELAAMTPRQAADRLYERAMSEHEAGDMERTAFFLDMGLQAYEAVPESDLDADARFHMGLMRLVSGDSAGARRSAERILGDEPDHLLGLILAARLADFTGEGERGNELRARLRELVDAAGGIPDRPEYTSHRPLIERELESDS
jgi:hypothetical protein